MEDREPRRRPAAAGRAVDLAVGEHGHVPLHERVAALVGEEDDAVDVAKLRLVRMDDLVPVLHGALDLPTELDQGGQVSGSNVEAGGVGAQRRVEGTAERDVYRQIAPTRRDLEVLEVDE